MVRSLALLLLALAAAQDPGKSPFSRRPAEPEKTSETTLEEYRKKINETPPKTAADHFELGNWCRTKALAEQARQHWTQAVGLDAEHAGARQALNHKKVDGKWLTEDEWRAAEGYVKVDGRWVRKEERDRKKLDGVDAVKVTVAFQPDASKEWFESEFKPRLLKAAEAVWKGTEGNQAIVEFACVDRSSQGTIVIANLDSDKCDKGAYGRTFPGRNVLLGGKFLIVTFLHEWGHWIARLPEEYGSNNKCKGCVMGNAGNMTMFFCDEKNHTASGSSCWTRLKEKFPGWKRRGAEEFGDAPEPKITFEEK